MEYLSGLVNVDPEILGGTPVFSGTRVPVQSLLQHLEAGISIEAFLDDFPSVKHEQAVQLLEHLESALQANFLPILHETIA
jgi:uncharacterized protein (DUF433 family)